MSHIALVDMDGTIADYDGAMRREMAALKSPDEPDYEPDPEGAVLRPWIEARRRAISLQPGFWRNLRKLSVGFDILQVLEACGFTVHILTKGPSTKFDAWKEKVEWCREHVPHAKVTVTEDKSLTFGRVLVDDWPPYFMGWLEHRPRGIVIVPAQPWNADAEKLAPGNIFRYDRDVHDTRTLHRILRAVHNRKNGEGIDLAEILARTLPGWPSNP